MTMIETTAGPVDASFLGRTLCHEHLLTASEPIRVQYPHGLALAQLWKVQVGRVPLLLLDANLAENARPDRSITGPLYGGDQEFTLIGGAVALFQDRKAALLVYKRQLHTISLFVFPAEGLTLPTDPRLRQSRGFSVVLWRQGDLGYALTSDLNGGDLQTLARRIADQR